MKINNDFILEPIVPRHFDDQPEYGVCTRINSHGDPVQEHGICPIPLLCKAQTDKHVCLCDQDQYFDENKRVCCKLKCDK